ncbi:zinc finger MYM-type protein 1-like [Aphis craccivora]|uniref:Zinc finger MYM-type protein 1-like n=1 Tax=Aphis craccivora TaxID=307492 RepID=A0A6G0Y3B1_APHCR|nr:zinc finger MYM-type protein 1-like [Aphis craccivora]
MLLLVTIRPVFYRIVLYFSSVSCSPDELLSGRFLSYPTDPLIRFVRVIRMVALLSNIYSFFFTNYFVKMNPLYDPVIQLLETPFRRWTTNDKNELLKLVLGFVEVIISRRCIVGRVYFLSQTKSLRTTTGYSDFKNISRSIKLHESAKEHIRCMLGLKHLENNKITIVDALNEHGSLF